MRGPNLSRVEPLRAPEGAEDASPGERRAMASSIRLARALVRHAERAMVRASDAVLVRGNSARLLRDGPAAFDAWIHAIEGAREWVHLENYIIRNDRMGRLFREVLETKAREGVRVRVLYDWVGCWATPRSFWRPLREAGADVRAFAPPRPTEPLRIFRRDHRKVVAVDGTYASVAGMCIGAEWYGDPGAGVPPWRDTGVEISGPAAAVIDRAFARTWRDAGPMLPLDEIPDPLAIPPAGDVSVRVVEGEPGRSRIYRLSQFVAVGVERRLWITDPYFVTPPAMTEAFAVAARDGVDVRIIVPAYNNWPIIGGFSRAGYRALLEAGVRLFEWEGPMIHAKTAVADGVWSRIGSSNLNLASLLSNWELDLAILDRSLAGELEDLFIEDLASSVEITLPPPGAATGRRALKRQPVQETPSPDPDLVLQAAREARRRAPRGSRGGRVLSRVSRASIVLARALIGQRGVGLEDRGWILAIAATLLSLSILGFLLPRLLAWPFAFILFWIGIASLYRAGSRRQQE
jgi:cardiolipin synthase A/B